MTTALQSTLQRAQAAEGISGEEALSLVDCQDWSDLARAARTIRDAGHGSVVTYSPKVFLPLTRLCRDVCHYCTFARKPQNDEPGFLRIAEMVAVAQAGQRAGCHEALFTLGDKPELRYASASAELSALGHESTHSYLAAAAEAVFEATGLLPHLNPGVLDRGQIVALKEVSASMGMMMESASERLCRKGGPHYGSPDKHPTLRLQTIEHAGELSVPFTTGLLIGIGETRTERVETLLALRRLHERYGHIQEIIVQNFRPKRGTPMAHAPAPAIEELVWTIAVARLIFGPEMNIQAPPNLSRSHLRVLLDAGINDWGGISPITKDHVNPEAPWPQVDELAAVSRAAGKVLTPRLPLYPAYALHAGKWLSERFIIDVTRRIDSGGFVRDTGWYAGQPAEKASDPPPRGPSPNSEPVSREIRSALTEIRDGKRLSEQALVRLFEARGPDFMAVCAAANELRSEVNGDAVSYVVNRNINYTNVCRFGCGFCAFSKGKVSDGNRCRPYDLTLEEIARRTREAWERGATEICLQGGIHPGYTGETYLEICRTVKQAVPEAHMHAFSPLEVMHGASTLGISVEDFLVELKAAGLNSLPGTAAEILDDDVRAILCPDKPTTGQWLDVVEAAHGVGLATTSTIMFGHVDRPIHWARHLLRLRDLQARTGGLTEFVPLPFVHMEAPIYLNGQARRGPTFRESILMHAVARLALHPAVVNIQTSWTKMGKAGARACLLAGANDLGGTLMNESISRAAGAAFGQEFSPDRMQSLIAQIGRAPRQRTTLYGDVAADRKTAARRAAPLLPTIERPMGRANAAAARSPLREPDMPASGRRDVTP